jgi:membrane-associated phospholipid phosphatase
MNPHLEALAARLNFPGSAVEPAGLRDVLRVCLGLWVLCALVYLLLGYHAGFHALNALGRDLSSTALQSLTYTGDTLFALAMMLIFSRRYPRILWTAVVAALIALAVSRGLKELVDASRPAGVLAAGALHVEGQVYRRCSFPSGHAVTAFVMAATFACYLSTARARWIAWGVASAIAMSRVLVGAHWPVDVLAGAAIGAGSAYAAVRICAHWQWGLRLHGHLLLVSCLMACALALLFVPVPYHKAEPLARSVALIALIVAFWNYAYAPQRLLRRGALSVHRRQSGAGLLDAAD